MKISTKLLLIILLAVTLIGITALSGVVASSNLLESQIKDKFTAISTYAMEKIHRLLSRRSEDITRLARDPVISSRRSTPRERAVTLEEYKRHFESYAPYASLSFYSLDGKLVAETKGGGRHAFPGFGAGLEQNRSFLLESAPAAPRSAKAFLLAHVVVDADNVPFGVVVADLPAESLQVVFRHPLRLFRVNSAFNADLIDAKGLILFSTRDKEGVFRDISPLYDAVRKAKTESGGSGTMLMTDTLGKREQQIVVFTRETAETAAWDAGWTLIISLPKRSALAPLMALKDRLALVFIGIGGIAVGIVLMFSRTITGPLARLSRAITEVGKGNLDVVLPPSSNDEIGRLSDVFNSMVGELRQLHGQLRDAASTDSLTGAYNRKSFEELLRLQTELARRYKNPLSLIMFDLDHFKRVNDTHGHLSGDYILKTLIGIVKDSIRRTDLLGRWGGEEFMLLTPGAGLEQAAELAEKIRKRVGEFHFATVGSVTISCGVAALADGDTRTDLIKKADDALYQAKDKGRNAVEVLA
jgi:diguanylate cyclase (GGDEF)-like protein